jgi:hypothetical protein
LDIVNESGIKAMSQRFLQVCSFVVVAIILVGCSSEQQNNTDLVRTDSYNELIKLFSDFRDFRSPEITDGVPDYTPEAMALQQRGLEVYKQRLAAISSSAWPVPQQVDYHLVRSEINALDFLHRVLKPWAHDPGFYDIFDHTLSPRSESVMIEITPSLPFSNEKIEDYKEKLQAIPRILEQAKTNLVLDKIGIDRATLVIRDKKLEHSYMQAIVEQLSQHHPDLVADAKQALTAIDDYRVWVEENQVAMTAQNAIGKEQFDWWVKNVLYIPYTWDELYTISKREYDRSIAFLKLEEHRNRNLPEIVPVADEDEYRERWYESELYIYNFLKNDDVFTVPDYFEPRYPAPWSSVYGRQGAKPEFFQRCEDIDPIQQILHNSVGHRLDRLRSSREDNPIRSNLSFYTEMIRSESLATAVEEFMLIAGLQDDRRRGREVTYIALANRGVRAMAHLKVQSNEISIHEAMDLCVDLTPYGWQIAGGYTVWDDVEHFLRLPGYKMSYVTGKAQFEQLLADRANQLGKEFNLKEFVDDFFATGMIPLSLIRWELTGYDDEIQKILN